MIEVHFTFGPVTPQMLYPIDLAGHAKSA